MPDFQQIWNDPASQAAFQAMEIHLSSRTEKTAITIEEYIQGLLTQGVAPEEIQKNLIQDFDTGGRIFGEFRNAFRSSVSSGLGTIAEIAGFEGMGVAPETEMIWQTVSEKPCPDCEARHGEVDTLENWQMRGLPKSGFSICREYCRCELVQYNSGKKDIYPESPIQFIKE